MLERDQCMAGTDGKQGKLHKFLLTSINTQITFDMVSKILVLKSPRMTSFSGLVIIEYKHYRHVRESPRGGMHGHRK